VTVVAIPRPAEPPLAAPPRGDEGPALSAVGDRGLARHEAPAITRVTIGRIEVRMAPPRPPAAPPSRPAPTLSLQDDLTRPKEPAQ
jgi:hypothetical protein